MLSKLFMLLKLSAFRTKAFDRLIFHTLENQGTLPVPLEEHK